MIPLVGDQTGAFRPGTVLDYQKGTPTKANTSEKQIKYSNTTNEELRMVRKYLKNNQ